MMVCGKYCLNIYRPTLDNKQLEQSNKKLSIGDSTYTTSTASEEIELKCHALFEADNPTMRLFIGIRPNKRCGELNRANESRHKSISNAPIVLTNELIKGAAAQFDTTDSKNQLLQSITSSVVEVSRDALSLIKFEPQQLNSSRNNTCLAEQVDANDGPLENGSGEFLKSILELSLDSSEANNGREDANNDESYDQSVSSPKWSIKEETSISISSLEVNSGTFTRGVKFGGCLCKQSTMCSESNNESNVNITTFNNSEIVTLSGENSFELERAEQERDCEGYKKKHKITASCSKQSRESDFLQNKSNKNKSLKATFSRNGRHFGHWLMATCSWKQAQTTSNKPILRFNKQYNHSNIVQAPTFNFMIMISYCHKEAQQYALSLKKSLEEIGLSVYLDVDEICKGCDWQDSLNEAIYNCHAFVPLVTASYGETLWTRREFKLADALDKHIIPINFCDTWPPARLAIQFATVQYISWLDEDYCNEFYGEEKDGGDELFTAWPKACVESSARQIKQSIRKRLAQFSADSFGSPFLEGDESSTISTDDSADSMFCSSSYSPELSNTQQCANQFRWFSRGEIAGNGVGVGVGVGAIQTSVKENNSKESMRRNTPARLDECLNEEESVRQSEMQISCRSFSLLPLAGEIETTQRAQMPAKIVETETTSLTMAKKKSLRFRAVKTFNKVRRRLNGHQELTRG